MQVGCGNIARVVGVVLVAAGGVLPHPATAQQRVWDVSGSGSFVVATDCRDCDEDVGIKFECRGLGRPADVTVPAVTVEQRPSGRRQRIEFFVDGLGMTYSAEVERQGLTGYVPRLRVSQNDPLIARLASGVLLRVVFAGKTGDVTLNGARAALAAFASQCAWRIAKDLAVPLDTTPSTPRQGPSDEERTSTRPLPPTERSEERADPRWQFFAGGGGTPSRLVFGAPGTDMATLVATCLPGGTRALVELPAGPSALEAGRSVQIGVHTSQGIRGVRGVVNQSAHATFPAEPKGLLWSTLRAGGAATFSVDGRPAGFVESQLGERAITNFLAACR